MAWRLITARADSQAVLAVIAFTATLFISGCGRGRDDLGQVSGRVTLDGEPLVNALVEFVPQGPGTTSFGRTDENGNYRMIFSHSLEGAQVGDNVVRITTRDIYAENGIEKWTSELVPPKYNRQSELAVTVQPGNNIMDFELESGDWKATPRRSTVP